MTNVAAAQVARDTGAHANRRDPHATGKVAATTWFFWMGLMRRNGLEKSVAHFDAIIRCEQDDGREKFCVTLPWRHRNGSGYNCHSNKHP
jgi:hypothetical protein